MTDAAANKDHLHFVPLGGLGEIGMNAALYGLERARVPNG